MRQAGAIRARRPRRAVIREQREPLVGAPVPLALVVARQGDEAQTAPPVGEVATAPARLDAEPDLSRFALGQEKPFDAAFDVALQRVVAEAESLPFVADAVH